MGSMSTRNEIKARLGFLSEPTATAAHPGAKAKMSKATDALDYIKSSISNGKTVYVQTGSRTTKITPQTYAKWEASGRPLFKMSSDGALLMASGSSYVRLTLADEMLARVSAMSRPGAKAKYQKEYILWALPKGETDRLEERPIAEGIQTPKQMDEAKRKAAAAGWHGFRVQILDMSKPFRWMARPGAKAKMGLAVPELGALHSSLGDASQIITDARSVKKDRALLEKIDAAYRAGDYIAASNGWRALSTGSRVTPMGQKFKQRMEISGYRFSRPGAKAAFAAPGVVVKEDAQYIYYYPEEDDRATFADVDGKGAYTVKSNRTGKPISAKTYRSWDEATNASNAINEKLPPLKKRKGFSRPGAKAKMDLTDTQRKVGYKWRVAYTKQLGKDQYLGGPPVTIQDDLLFATEGAARQWADAMLKKGWFKGQGGGPEKILKATVLMASRPGSKATAAKPSDLEREDVKAGLKVMSEADTAVSDKIRTLIAEGKPQEQAVAIALDMKRRGEI